MRKGMQDTVEKVFDTLSLRELEVDLFPGID